MGLDFVSWVEVLLLLLSSIKNPSHKGKRKISILEYFQQEHASRCLATVQRQEGNSRWLSTEEADFIRRHVLKKMRKVMTESEQGPRGTELHFMNSRQVDAGWFSVSAADTISKN